MTKHPLIYQDEDVELYLEMEGNNPYIHCTVLNWSPSLYKRFKKDFQKVLESFWKKGYTVVYAPDMDEKTTKFAKMFGFKETPHKIIGEDLQVRGVLECHRQ